MEANNYVIRAHHNPAEIDAQAWNALLASQDAPTPFLRHEYLSAMHGSYSAVAETGRMPNIIHLYRRPMLDYWAEHDETLGHLVTHVLIHEIGHHFGLSDQDMEAIEGRAG